MQTSLTYYTIPGIQDGAAHWLEDNKEFIAAVYAHALIVRAPVSIEYFPDENIFEVRLGLVSYQHEDVEIAWREASKKWRDAARGKDND